MFLIGLSVVLVLLYVYFAKKNKFWLDKNVKSLNPTLLFGNIWPIIAKRSTFFDLVDKFYYAFPEERYVGIFHLGSRPILIVRDPELIRKVTVKDFDVFPEHTQLFHDETDPLWSRNLFSSREQKWRQMRPTLSPAFTSSKMKYMFVLVKDCAEEFCKYFLEQNKPVITIDSKDTFTRYTNDVIATVAFGVKCNSLKNPENEFYRMGVDATNFRGLKSLKFAVGKTIAKLFDIKIFSKEVRAFFTNLVAETIRIREEQSIVRPDMINLLMQAMKGKVIQDETVSVDTGFATVEESNSFAKIPDNKGSNKITTLDVTAQALVFFLAGFDTVSTLMCFLAHELALNQDIQQRLRNEIDEASEDCDGSITYEKLMSLKYLDMVISETLRKWPPLVVSDRCSVKPYTITPEKPNEKPLHLPQEMSTWLPIYAIHRDPQYYPEPNKFDPERFSDENKHNIKPFTYLPFGVGPRNCIGSRFALMECKLLFFHTMKSFEICVVDKTPINMKFTSDFNIIPVNGWWVGLKQRRS